VLADIADVNRFSFSVVKPMRLYGVLVAVWYCCITSCSALVKPALILQCFAAAGMLYACQSATALLQHTEHSRRCPVRMLSWLLVSLLW
jgi:hypothetical protein